MKTEEIRELKLRIGQAAENIIASGMNLKRDGKKYHCPNTTAHTHGDKDASMSWDKNLLQFKCFACGELIDIYSYYSKYLNYSDEDIREMSGTTTNNVKSNNTVQPQKDRDNFINEFQKVRPITTECINYIKSRGINEDTIKHFKLGSYNGLIAFPYYHYSTPAACKTRKPINNPGKPKMLSITGSKPCFYNMDNIDLNNKKLIICEGEFDCMVLYQCGFTNTVSIGAGANSINGMIEQDKKFLDNFSSIIIISDNDAAGIEMDKKALAILGDKAKIANKKLFQGEKDINDLFLKYGKEAVVDVIEDACLRIEGRRDLDKQPYRGLKQCKGNYVPTGIKAIDYALNDLAPKRLTLITGRSNGGKTTFVKQIMANAIDKGNKVYLMNGENDAEYLLNEFYRVVTGRDKDAYDTIRINKREFKEPKPETLKQLQAWHRKKLYMFNKGESKLKTIEDLTEMLEEEIKFNQYDLVVIDNLMSILSVTAAEKYEQQGDFVQKLCDLAKNYNTHIILVLHPNKTYRKNMDLDFEQISGSSDIYNKADNIITVTRVYNDSDEGRELLQQGVNGFIEVLKNRYSKELPRVSTHFDNETGALLEISETKDILHLHFNWNGRQKSPDDMQEVLIQETPFD